MSETKNARISAGLAALVSTLFLFSALGGLSQSYQSLMWRISGNGLHKDSYLYGTMHVSGRTVFHLGDPFYDAMERSDVVALELEPELWLHDMMAKPEHSSSWLEVGSEDYYDMDLGEYSLEGKFLFRYDVLSTMQKALSVTPPLLNYMLFRYNEFESTSDFEEDTWLDMHIYQCGKKMGKQTIGLETFDQTVYYGAKAEQAEFEESMEDDRGYITVDYVELENAYRRQDLDYIDSIDTYVDSKAFNEYILHARNKVFVHTMDSVLQTGQSLFAGMGCAHLPGEKGVIESLRALGYTVEPMDKGSRNTRRRDKLEKQVYNRKYVPSDFGVNQPSVMLPDEAFQLACNDQFASWVALDIPNGGSFSVYRVRTNAALRGIDLQQQELTLDSAIFEGLPGDLVHSKTYQLQGYKAWDIYNRTTRDDIHRMVVVLMENEIFLFKVTAGGEKIEHGYANEFFQSIRLPDNYNKVSESSILPNQSMTWNNVNAHVVYSSESPLFSSKSLNFAGVQHGKWPVGFIQYTFPEMSYIEESSYELRRMADAFMMDNSLNEITYHESSALKIPSANGFYQDADGRNYCVRFYLKGLTYLASFVLCDDVTGGNQMLDEFAWDDERYSNWSVQRDSMHLMQVELPYQHLWPLVETLDNPYMQYDWTQTFQPPGSQEMMHVQITRHSEYADVPSRQYMFDLILNWSEGNAWKVDTLAMDSTQFGLNIELLYSDTLSSRVIWNKVIIQYHTRYELMTNYDASVGMGEFAKRFAETFVPIDTVNNLNYFAAKDSAFIKHLYTASKEQVDHILDVSDYVDFEPNVTPLIREFLDRKSELNYTEDQWSQISKTMIAQLAGDTSQANLNFLKKLALQHPDSGLYQAAILNAVASIKTYAAQKYFHDRMMDEPPLVDDYFEQPQFLSHADSLRLIQKFLPDYFNLLSMDEYKWDILEVLSTAADSGYLVRKDCKQVVSELLISAKLELRRLKASKELDEYAQAEFQYLLSLLRLHMEDPDVAAFFRKLRGGNHPAEIQAVFDFNIKHDLPIPDTLLQKMCIHPNLLFHAIIQLDSTEKIQLIPAPYLQRDTLIKMLIRTVFNSEKEVIDSVEIVEQFQSRIRSNPLSVYTVKFKAQQSDKLYGIVLAFDARNPKLVWPSFFTSGEVQLEDDASAKEELQEEWKRLDRLSRYRIDFYCRTIESLKAMAVDYY